MWSTLTQNTDGELWNVNAEVHLEYQAIKPHWVNAPCVHKRIGLGSKILLASIPSCSVYGEYASASNPIPYRLPLYYVISLCTSYFSNFADRFPFAYSVHIDTMLYAWQHFSLSSRHRRHNEGYMFCSSSSSNSLVSLHRHWQKDQSLSACDTSLCMWHHTVPLGSESCS